MMQNFNNFVTYKPCTDCVIISCKLGLWSITGPYNEETIKQAEQKYKQFKKLGKYKAVPQEKTARAIKIK